jgi:DNA-binding XRE family transcriptional regulator
LQQKGSDSVVTRKSQKPKPGAQTELQESSDAPAIASDAPTVDVASEARYFADAARVATVVPPSKIPPSAEQSLGVQPFVTQPLSLQTRPALNSSSQYQTLLQSAKNNLSSQQIETTAQYLRHESSLLHRVSVQLAQHLVEAYRQRLSEQRGKKSAARTLPYFEVTPGTDSSAPTLKTNLNGDALLSRIRRLIEDLFEKNQLWEKGASEIWLHIFDWASEELQTELGEAALTSLSQAEFDQAFHQHLFERDENPLQNRIVFLEEFYSQSLTRRIVEDLDLLHYPISGLEQILDIIPTETVKPAPSGEVPLSHIDQVAAIPTGLPIVSSISAQLKADLWQPDANGIAYFRYHAKNNANNYLEHYITSPGDIEALPWEAAEQIINKFGFNTVKLQLIFAAYAMRQSKPWEGTFTIKATDIIEELGWDRNHSSNLPTKRNEVASIAYALSCLMVKAVWIEGRGKKQIDASTPIGRMWEVLIDSHGQFDWISGKINEPDEVYITIRPGLWTAHFLNQAGSKAKEALYQFGYLALNILKLDPYHDELTLRLAIHLTLDVRIRARDRNPYEYRVKTLLEAVIPEAQIQEARQSSEKARGLFSRWNHALKLLASLGWQPVAPEQTAETMTEPSEASESSDSVFYTVPYPAWLDPESKLKKPRGWIDLWLEHKLMIKPPHPIPERMDSLMNHRKAAAKPLKTSAPLTGADVKAARKEKRWTQAKLAGTLKVHQSLVAKIESGDRPIRADLENDLRRILDL